jgi:hypothetical protein
MTRTPLRLLALFLAAGPALALEPSNPLTCGVGDVACESGIDRQPPLPPLQDNRPDPDRVGHRTPTNRPVRFGPAGGTARGTELQPGATLYGRSNDYLLSSTVMLRMQSDCNLVAYQYPTNPVWASHTDRKGADCRAVMQSDGNLVVYTGAGKALWASGTAKRPGGRLVAQDDGNVVVYIGTQPQWATNTMIHRK